MKKILCFTLGCLVSAMLVTSVFAKNETTLPQNSRSVTAQSGDVDHPTNIYVYNYSDYCFYVVVPAANYDDRVLNTPLCPNGIRHQIVGYDNNPKYVYLYYSRNDKYPFLSEYVNSHDTIYVYNDLGDKLRAVVK